MRGVVEDLGEHVQGERIDGRGKGRRRRWPSALTHLEVKGKVPFYALPTTLRSLSLSSAYLEASAAEEARGGTTYLSQRFPDLTSLDSPTISPFYDTYNPAVSLAPLLGFLQAHSTQITEFTAGVLHNSIMRDVAALPWPMLRKLKCDPVSLALWSPPPALRELKVHCAGAFDSVVAEHWLPLLTDVHIDSQLTLSVLDRLRRCPARKALDAWQVGEWVAHNPEFFRSLLSECEVTDEGWEWLCQFKALRRLFVSTSRRCPPCLRSRRFP